jgi:competence protein ComEA
MSEWLERHRGIVLTGLTLAVAAGLLLLWSHRPRAVPIIISTPVPTATATITPIPTPAPVRVYVTGAVVRPDVYVLPAGSIIKDAVLAAGGATSEADLDRVNLAVQVQDQQQVYVPRVGEAGSPAVRSATPVPIASPVGGKVNINTASVEELDALPGVGPTIAQRIVDYRSENGPFRSIEDLMQVKGIGAATFADLKDRVTIQ